ncbi:MAG: dihydroorotase [Gammaproteobacteria bacterium]|nr:dihydroorotase [Gammaproteobacteria bacterium]
MNKLTITLPDDWHIHLRDTQGLALTVPAASRTFGRAIVMPNLLPPITNTQQADSYRQRILKHRPEGKSFTPLMTLYLTDKTQVDDITSAAASGFIHAAKLYPAGATTNSDSGVTCIENIYPVLEAMQTIGMPLLIHGETTSPDIDIFDREAVFIETVLKPLTAKLPDLKIVLEHITTREAVEFVESSKANIAATITAHHLLYNRNQMLVGGIRPHYYCLPILKRNTHQHALISAATSGNSKFFLGTDSAPHPINSKESHCGCAGCYTSCIALELYAEVFDAHNALDRLEGFASFFGADFYGLPRNTETVTLIKESWKVPDSYPMGDDIVIPLKAGELIQWKIVDS